MKKAKLIAAPLLLVLLLTASFTPSTKQINLNDAIAQKFVKCTVESNPESPHYVRPVMVTLTNLKNTAVQVQIPNGQQFFPEDDKYQNMVVTFAGTIVLPPNGKKTVPVFAMCTEAGDGAPGAKLRYKTGPPAQGKLAKIAKYIEELKCNDIVGQYAVWCITNDHGIDEITGPDEKKASQLQQFVSKLTGKPVPPKEVDNYKNNFHSNNMQVSYTGTFEFSFSAPRSIQIALFNANNVVVRELVNNPACPEGVHKVEWAFDNSVYTEDIYYVRLIADGDIRINRKLDMHPED